MFDIGFFELLLIAVVGLVVIGPERLPRVAMTLGRWFGRARYFVSSVKADIDKEIRAEELKRIMNEQAKSSGLHEIVEESKSTLNETKSHLEDLNNPGALLGDKAQAEPPESVEDKPADSKQ